MAMALYTIILSFLLSVMLLLAVVSLFRRSVRGAGLFMGLTLAASFYALGSIFEIRGSTVDALHFWLSVEYLGLAVAGPVWLAFALAVTGRMKDRLPRLLPLAFLIPAVVLVAVWTNDAHHLFYASILLTRHGPFTVPQLGKGPLYWLHMAYLDACILAGAAVVLRHLARSQGVHRRQAVVLAAGSLLPLAGEVAYLSGITPWGLDVSPIGMAASALLYAWGLYRFQILDLTQIIHWNVFTNTRDGILVADRKGRLLAVNPAMTGIFPSLVPDSMGAPMATLLPDHPELLGLLEGPVGRERDLSVTRGGSTLHYEAAASALRGRRGVLLGTIVTLRDITARVELLARVERLAVTDELTGVSNRRHFMGVARREMDRARRHGRSLAVAILDLDHFKEVNDVHGHLAGDAVLAAVAQACAQCLRSSDLLGRYGGEEFAVLLPDATAQEASAAAERLRAAVAAVHVEAVDVRVTASFGVSCRQRVGGEELSLLLKEADGALYRAKEGGRNRVVIGG